MTLKETDTFPGPYNGPEFTFKSENVIKYEGNIFSKILFFRRKSELTH